MCLYSIVIALASEVLLSDCLSREASIDGLFLVGQVD